MGSKRVQRQQRGKEETQRFSSSVFSKFASHSQPCFDEFSSFNIDRNVVSFFLKCEVSSREDGFAWVADHAHRPCGSAGGANLGPQVQTQPIRCSDADDPPLVRHHGSRAGSQVRRHALFYSQRSFLLLLPPPFSL